MFNKPVGRYGSFAEYCNDKEMLLLAAAPLSMGLLTSRGPPDWHPASTELKAACRLAVLACQELSVDIATLALLVALSNPRIPCTILGVANLEEAEKIHAVSLRIKTSVDCKTLSQKQILLQVLTENEKKAWKILGDPTNGPFASLWREEKYTWDGIQEARSFWEQFKDQRDVVPWQVNNPK